MCLRGLRAGGGAACAAVRRRRIAGDHVGGAGASLEVLKLAYKRNERIIRVVETDGCNSIARLALEPGRKLVETNLVEWSSGATLKPEDGVVEVPLKPFEIRTFRIR